jgi:hypothetical protein
MDFGWVLCRDVKSSVQFFSLIFSNLAVRQVMSITNRAHIRKNYDSSFYRSRLSSGADADASSAGCAAWG